MIIPVKQTNTIYQGATWEWTYKVVDDNDVPVDITDCTAKLTLKQKYSDLEADALVQTDGAVNSANSQVHFIIGAAATIGVSWIEAVFDAELYWPDGITIDKLAYGKFKLVKEVTTDA